MKHKSENDERIIEYIFDDVDELRLPSVFCDLIVKIDEILLKIPIEYRDAYYNVLDETNKRVEKMERK